MTSFISTPVKLLIEKFKGLSAEDKAVFLLEVFTVSLDLNHILLSIYVLMKLTHANS